MKKIGIASRIIDDGNYGEVRDALDVNWIKLIDYLGFIPIVIPTGVDYPDYIKSSNIDTDNPKLSLRDWSVEERLKLKLNKSSKRVYI